MKKLFALGTLFLLPIFSLSAGQYVGIHGGSDYLYHTKESNSGQKVGYKVGGVYGYDWGNNLRTEVELSYRHAERSTKYVENADKIESKEHKSNHSLALMANVIYDVNQLTWYDVSPYVGLGVGYSQNTQKAKLQSEKFTNEEKERDDRFAWQGIVGLKYPIAEKMTMAAQYNYFCASEHAKDHSFSLSLLRSF